MVSIRPATVEDAPELCRIHQDAVRAKSRSHYSDELIEAWIGSRKPYHYRVAIEQNGESMWVAVAGNQIEGFASLKGHELMALYAGSNAPRGTGTALLMAMMAEAGRAGATELFTTASLNAVDFYSRHGFRELGPSELVRSGFSIPAMRMHRKVAG